MAHDDEPERAARARAGHAPTLAERAASRPDLPALTVHVGINTGPVIAGAVGDGSQFGVMGDTINTASRVMGLAQPGQTLVSADTARRVRRRYHLIDRGEHRVKGKSQPLAVFEVAGTTDEASGSTTLTAPFLGRENEVRVLEGALRSTAADRQGRTVAITGEAGIGKTRLIDEVVARSTSGWRVLRAEARLAGDHPRGSMLSALGPLAGGTGAATSDAALIDAVCAEAAGRPILVALDEADRADDGTIKLATALSEATQQEPVVWVLIGRRLPSGITDRAAPWLRLEPLDAEATATLFDNLLPGALTPAQAAGLARRASGNPTFATEIAHALIDESVAVVSEGDRYRLVGDPDQVPLPGTLTELIEARIAALDTTARVVLQEASVVGVRFRRRLLEAVASGPTSLQAALAELAIEELIEPPAAGDRDQQWSFRSELIRDVAYESLLRRRRLVAHRAVAEALLALEPDEVDTNAELLAHHFERSDQPERAIPYLERSVAHAIDAGSPTDAGTTARRAVAIASRHPSAVEADLLHRLDRVASGRVEGGDDQEQEKRR